MRFNFATFLKLTFAAVLPADDKGQLVVVLDTAILTGSSFLGVESFKNIPFAQPPIGDLRLRPPQPVTRNLGTIDATGMARSCPQSIQSSDLKKLSPGLLQTLLNTRLFSDVAGISENCLTVNVQRLAGIKTNAKLPVFVWIYGGGFTAGSSSMYDGSSIIRASLAAKEPVLFVAANYRLGGYGFMPGKEILESGNANLGLLDQRLALEWVADNIAKFGGDPDKVGSFTYWNITHNQVTIGGESAGAISVFDQMALYDGNNIYKGKALFRGAIMNSGSMIPADPVDCPKGQVIYDQVVREAGCAGQVDTLACLRSLDFDTFNRAATSPPGIFDYSSVALSYLPRPDGKLLSASPVDLAKQGKFAQNCPIIVGDLVDEGSVFALAPSNLTTTAGVVIYLEKFFFHGATRAQIQALVDSYPDDPRAGSPFGTGYFNQLYPQYKRLAALLGDATFTLTRRMFLEFVAPQVPKAFSYLASYGYGIPILGSFHALDVFNTFFVPGYPQFITQSYIINFVNSGDVNQGIKLPIAWPQWTKSQQLYNIGWLSSKLTPDTVRPNSAAVLRESSSVFNI